MVWLVELWLLLAEDSLFSVDTKQVYVKAMAAYAGGLTVIDDFWLSFLFIQLVSDKKGKDATRIM